MHERRRARPGAMLTAACLAVALSSALLGACAQVDGDVEGSGPPAETAAPGSSPATSVPGWSLVALGESSGPTSGSLAAFGGTLWASTFAGVWRSTDGGASWEHRCADRYYDLCFTSADDGWAVGDDGLFATADGGATWARVALADAPRDLLTVRFADARHGAVAGGQYGARNGGWVFVTADRGASWEGRRLTEGKLKGVCFADAREGWAVGDMDIVHTADGGRTWSVQLHRDNGGLALSDVVCADDARRCWAASGLDGAIWKTDDGGLGWRRVYGGREAGVGGIAFATADVGFAAGILYPAEGSAEPASGLVLSTTDGGETWEEERLDEVGGLHDVVVLDGDRLVVLGDGVVLIRPL